MIQYEIVRMTDGHVLAEIEAENFISALMVSESTIRAAGKDPNNYTLKRKGKENG